MSAADASRYTRGEEFANMLTHACGVLLSLIGAGVLLVRAGASQALIPCAIYSATLIGLYLASTMYHHAPSPRRRLVDHVAIFLLIAGTYTPFVLISLRGGWGWSLFAVIWILAALGTWLELAARRDRRRLMVALYVAMGWIGLVALKPLVAALPREGLWLLFGGGAAYTLGVVFYRMRGMRYHHAVWHLFVLGGSALQYFAILYYVLPAARA